MECRMHRGAADLNEREVNYDTYDTRRRAFSDHRHLIIQEDKPHHQLGFKNALIMINPLYVCDCSCLVCTVGG